MPDNIARGYKRRNYFIDKRFQADFILKFSLLVLAGGLATVCIVYFLALQSTTVAFVNSRVVARTTADFVLPFLIQTVAVVTVGVGLAAGILSLFISHRISGPLYHCKKVIESLERGELPAEFNIRQRDQLRELVNAINGMIRKRREELTQLQAKAASLKEKISSISEAELPENKRQTLNEIKKLFAELDKIVNFNT